MELRPHLTFSKPSSNSFKGKPFPNIVQTPTLTLQKQRVKSKVERVQQAFAEHITITQNTDGLVPEKVLVLEVAGEVSSFINAIRDVPGFEFLAQELQDSHYESELFYRLDDKGKHKPVEKFAYLTMSSQAGLQKLLSIWKRFEKSGTLPNGQKSFARAFEQLVDMRVWDTRDRLDIRDGGDSSMLTDWQERLNYLKETGTTELVPFEIELWFREGSEARRNAEQHLSSVILKCGGEVSNAFLFEEIGYHALIGYLPATEVQAILDSQGQHIELMQCDEVMFFRPVGQCVVSPSEGDGLEEAREFKSNEQIYGDTELPPVIALLDGLPMENHAALAGRLNIDDPDGFEQLYKGDPSVQLHGTSMASLIIHGDLNDGDALPQPRRLYTRPIMAPGAPSLNGHRFESIPDEYLPLDLVHRAVKRMKEGDASEAPTAPKVKVINLSIGERYRLFDRRMSPWARMLDWLSFKYDVLFVVSAGNMLHDVELPVTEAEFLQCSEHEKKNLFFNTLALQQPERRMCSPAESVNAITVRSSHSDQSVAPLPPGVLDLMPLEGMPSPINPITLGRKNAVKPELMMPGGRQAYRQKSFLTNEPIAFSIANSVTLKPGVKSAYPGPQGSLNSYQYSAGTSNAAALATRRLGFLYETLQDLKNADDKNMLTASSDAVLLKAMLCHGAEHNEAITKYLEKQLKTDHNKRTFRSVVNQFVGFGHVNEGRIHGCKPSQATLLGTGTITEGECLGFAVPLPACLAASTEQRRLVVTIAWLSPVNARHNDYRGAQLWGEPEKKKLNLGPNLNYHHHLKHGTVCHDVFEGEKAAAFMSGDELKINVYCKLRAGLNRISVPFAIIATLDSPNLNLPIYSEVKQELEVKQSQSTDA